MHECIGNEYCDRSGCASYIYNASNRAKRANESARFLRASLTRIYEFS